jgi:hypothetical protein
MRGFTRSILAALFAAALSQTAAARDRTPVVVELFTAQGCSACPKANLLLDRYADRSDVVALTFPVDYWDYLGWRDTFAQPAFTERQRAYADRLKLRSLTTPEFDIDGVWPGRRQDRPTDRKHERRSSAGASHPPPEAWRESSNRRRRKTRSRGRRLADPLRSQPARGQGQDRRQQG